MVYIRDIQKNYVLVEKHMDLDKNIENTIGKVRIVDAKEHYIIAE